MDQKFTQERKFSTKVREEKKILREKEVGSVRHSKKRIKTHLGGEGKANLLEMFFEILLFLHTLQIFICLYIISSIILQHQSREFITYGLSILLLSTYIEVTLNTSSQQKISASSLQPSQRVNQQQVLSNLFLFNTKTIC